MIWYHSCTDAGTLSRPLSRNNGLQKTLWSCRGTSSPSRRSLIACGKLGDSSTPRVLVGPCTDSLVQRLGESTAFYSATQRRRGKDGKGRRLGHCGAVSHPRLSPRSPSSQACSRTPVELTALLCIGAFADERTGVEINSPETIHIRAPHLAIERALVH